MPKYTVISIFSASFSEDVQAENPSNALEKATHDIPSLCYQCSSDVDLDGSIHQVIVLDEDGYEVLKEKWI